MAIETVTGTADEPRLARDIARYRRWLTLTLTWTFTWTFT